jgi:RecA-family ATPase
VKPVNGATHNGKHTNGTVYKFGNMLKAETILARPWIFGNILLAHVVTLLVGAGGAGKSVLLLTIAAHLAVGKEFMGMKPYRPGRSIIYNAEDDLVEASRRLNAICETYGLDKEKVCSSIALVNSDDLDLQVTAGTPPVVNQEKVAALIAAAKASGVELIGIDPLAETHSANENDNMQVKYVMAVFRMVARQTNAAVLVAAHTGKPPLATTQGWAGNQNAARGASAQAASARIVLTLFGASEADCEDIGILPAERSGYVRLDGAKANFAAAEKRPRWLRWQERLLPSGDKVGVLVEHDASDAYTRATRETGEILARDLLANGSAAMTLDEAANVLRQNNTLLAKEDTNLLKKRVVRLLSVPIPVASGACLMLDRTDGHLKITIK